MTFEPQLRTAAWHGDAAIRLEFPSGWNITTHWPRTPAPLTDGQILERLENPVGQPRIRELCKGKKRPVILVDDVNRPTPAARIIPSVLKEFSASGIPSSSVTIVMARGSHGAPASESMLLKVGQEAATSCRLTLHDPYRNTARIGRTSFGTPVHVNRDVLNSDFVMGISGVYPNNTAGFGGGVKLALGVLDIRVISQLHRKHKGAGWGAQDGENNFRKDLDEIARMIGLQTMITGHVDANRELVRATSGDFRLYYKSEVAFAREAFRAPKPTGADVVISNAFPNDLSLTFVHMKGVYPLRHAPPEASRIVLGACSEGEGFHGVYPIVRTPLLHEQRDRLRRISLMTTGEMAKKIAGKLTRVFRPPRPEISAPSVAGKTEARKAKNPIWMYRTGVQRNGLPPTLRGMRILHNWDEILNRVREEQGGRDNLNVVVYPCAPLQVIE
jgi:nickel-dependent lactate racemase